MEKVCSILLSMAMLFSLASCSGGEPAASESSASEEPFSSEEPVASEESSEAGGTLIAYFSWSGNTEQMAQTIQAEIGGDLFKIEPATP